MKLIGEAYLLGTLIPLKEVHIKQTFQVYHVKRTSECIEDTSQ